MKHTHKNPDAAFELPEDITQKQLEAYEKAVVAFFEQDGRDDSLTTDAPIYRSRIEAAFAAGFLTPGEGCPQSAKDLDGASVRVTSWMGEVISDYVRGLKYTPPN